MLNYSDKQSFPPKVIQICMKNNFENRFLNFCETSLNIQNGGAHNTIVKLFNCP